MGITHTNSRSHAQQLKAADEVLPGAGEGVWTRGTCLALAQNSCTYCLGLGKRVGHGGKDVACNCVFRAIFRACYARFRSCASWQGTVAQVHIYDATPSAGHDKVPFVVTAANGPASRRRWGHPKAEYAADFCLVSARVLSPRQYEVFKFHFLLGADWKACCRRLKIDRGNFFHEVYRIQQVLGRTFAELRPYALYPVDEYFSISVVGSRAVETHGTPASDSPAAGCGPKACAAGAGVATTAA